MGLLQVCVIIPRGMPHKNSAAHCPRGRSLNKTEITGTSIVAACNHSYWEVVSRIFSLRCRIVRGLAGPSSRLGRWTKSCWNIFSGLQEFCQPPWLERPEPQLESASQPSILHRLEPNQKIMFLYILTVTQGSLYTFLVSIIVKIRKLYQTPSYNTLLTYCCSCFLWPTLGEC